VVAGLIQRPFASPRLLNVNIPNVPLEALKGYRMTRLGRRHVAQPVVRVESPRGEPMFWVGAPGAIKEAGPGTDFHALQNQEVSITPLRVDLGDSAASDEVAAWLESLP